MTKVKTSSHKSKSRQKPVTKEATPPNQNQRIAPILEDDEEINSGFSSYLRSSEGAAMMRLFIMGNTLVVFITFAWPQIQETISIVKEMWAGEQ